MSVKHSDTQEIITWSEKNMVKLIEIYSNQKKSKWIEIPANQENDTNISPFHMIVDISNDMLDTYTALKGKLDIVTLLTYAHKIINAIFKVNNSSCIVLQQTIRHKQIRVIYPEIVLTYYNEQKLIATLQQYIPVYEDTDTQLPNSTKYKCVGIFNTDKLSDDDSLWLTSLNGIQFSQVLGQIHHTVYKHETELK